jgi:5'-methylthioadenosine phosphorylase
MLAIIGGSGLYPLAGLEISQQLQVVTPFGLPSDLIYCGNYADQQVLFLSRHGQGHRLLLHEINYRANIFALKQLGATQVLSISAAGSLREAIAPGDLALVEQYFDHTRGVRQGSFFGAGLCAHISTAQPCCPALNGDILAAAQRLEQTVHSNSTYACVEGPRLGTSAESHFLRDAVKADLVGMSNIPEAFLAREAELAYSSLCLITDYDCWMEDQSKHVNVEQFLKVYGHTLERAQKLLAELLAAPLSPPPLTVRRALSSALLTDPAQISHAQQYWLNVLQA